MPRLGPGKHETARVYLPRSARQRHGRSLPARKGRRQRSACSPGSICQIGRTRRSAPAANKEVAPRPQPQHHLSVGRRSIRSAANARDGIGRQQGRCHIRNRLAGAGTRREGLHSTIAIVFAYSGDPVADGLVASFNRPGGNVTGAAFVGTTLIAKRMALKSYPTRPMSRSWSIPLARSPNARSRTQRRSPPTLDDGFTPSTPATQRSAKRRLDISTKHLGS